MKDIDLILLGGGLAACMAAREAARQGLRVALVERRGSLGHELTATATTWIQNGACGGELPLLTGALKKRLMIEQLDMENVPLLFACSAALGVSGERVTGVLLGSRYGLHYLAARAVIDTQNAAGALLGLGVPGPARRVVSYNLEIEEIGYTYESAYTVAPKLGLLHDRITLHPLVKDRCVTIQFSFEAAAREHADRADDSAQWTMLARQKAHALVVWLREQVEAFRDSRLAALAPEARAEPYGWTAPAGYEGLHALEQSVPLAPGTRELEALRDAVERDMRRICAALPAAPPLPTRFCAGASVIPYEACAVMPMDDRGLALPLLCVAFDDRLIRRRSAAGVLLAGAGTAGMMAARALCDENADFTLLEENSEPGGTNTVGGVLGYWHGYRGGINPSVDAAVSDICASVTGEGRANHKAATVLYYSGLLLERRARCFFGAVVCGAFRRGDRIGGLLAVCADGLCAFDAEVTIDTTGDGTVAALAGLPYELGDPDDGLTQSFSQWGREIWHTRNFKDVRTTSDLDVLYTDRYSELLRGCYLAHRVNSDWDFSDMPTVRESRRVRGEYALMLSDILNERVFEDTVCVTDTPFDAHGLGSSALCDMQLVVCKEPLRARIPYRCYIPAGAEGLLVGGKAFSGERDAVCVCRMNADLRNAGYMLGMAAHMAAREGCGVRGIDLTALRARLRALEILPQWASQTAPAIDWSLCGGRVELARALLADREEALAQLAACSGAAALDARAHVLARAWFGDAHALEETAGDLCKAALAGALRTMDGDHAAVCQALMLLARAGDARYAAALKTAVEHARPAGAPLHAPNAYYRSRVDHFRVGNYSILLALAKACARCADASLAAPLEELLEREYVRGYVTASCLETPKPFFCSYLELRLARALACCGGRGGFLRLAEYLADVRYSLSEPAHKALVELLGEDCGYQPQAWTDLIGKRACV